MSKYDCNKTLDYVHERNRMCKSIAFPSCVGCPLRACDHCDEIDGFEEWCIEAVQKWSDEHPEVPKLTKKDRMFLECFGGVGDRKICKDSEGCAFYYYDAVSSMLSPDMFKALEPQTVMTFDELLKLEVEE